MQAVGTRYVCSCSALTVLFTAVLGTVREGTAGSARGIGSRYYRWSENGVKPMRGIMEEVSKCQQSDFLISHKCA